MVSNLLHSHQQHVHHNLSITSHRKRGGCDRRENDGGCKWWGTFATNWKVIQPDAAGIFPQKKSGGKKSLPLSTSHQTPPSRYLFLCRPSSVSAQVCRSPESPRSAGQHNTDKAVDPSHRPPRLWCDIYDISLFLISPSFCPQTTLTLVFLSSAVVSSNGSLSLNLISVVLKVLWVFMHTIPWSSTVTTRLGLVLLPTCRVAKPTPADKHVQCKLTEQHRRISTVLTANGSYNKCHIIRVWKAPSPTCN